MSRSPQQGGGVHVCAGELFSASVLELYAAMAALVTLGALDALESVDRKAIWRFLLALSRSTQQGGRVHVCAGEP